MRIGNVDIKIKKFHNNPKRKVERQPSKLAKSKVTKNSESEGCEDEEDNARTANNTYFPYTPYRACT